ncbi:MAG: 2-C-methyl-D-erythritol 2,4-cyclodiphosphate synthase [Hornefia sp.]|nr:2-C-methyl-D-erythritol 2,4-cyclodiphosphate synthase [Hornefia sp.]
MRIGHGFDVHAFAQGRKLILGGVEIPCDKGLSGHSDADVLTHALMDAMLGAACLGDIGRLFPDTEERYRGISSLKLLCEVSAKIDEAGYRLINADITVICQKPKLRPYIDEMSSKLAGALRTGFDAVSIKATTTEKLGFTGREEGIAAEAVCLLEKK